MVAECYDDEGYQCAYYHAKYKEEDIDYDGLIWERGNFPDHNTYRQALWTKSQLPNYSPQKSFMSVEIVNKGTDNIYNDDWLDVRLYAKDRVEHPYSKMYIPVSETFYAGFHARNTRELPYDIEIHIAKEIIPLSRIEDKRLIRRTIEFGTQY